MSFGHDIYKAVTVNLCLCFYVIVKNMKTDENPLHGIL